MAYKRGNGEGTAYKERGGWTAAYVDGYISITLPDGTLKKKPNRKKQRGFETKKEALEFIQSLKKQIHDIKYLNYHELYELWIADYKDRVGKSTMDCYKAANKYFMSLNEFLFNTIMIEDWQSCIDECPKGRRTKENMKALVGLLYKYAIPRKQSDSINLAEYLKVDGDKGTYPAFTIEQVKAIRKATEKNIPHADDVLCMIYLGFRPTELFNLTKESYYEMDKCSYLVGGSKTAAGKGRAVTISPVIFDIIKRKLEKASPWLFPRDDGNQLTPDYFRDNYFYQVLDMCGIQPIPTKEKPAYYVPYSCRHTFSNFLADVSGADKDKAALIGHEDYTTTKKMYQSAELENMRKITDQFCNLK